MDAPMDPCRGRSSSSRTPAHAERGQRLTDVIHTVSDVVQALASPGQEPPHRGVRPQRLQ